ncbi:MAG: hypothetical protein ABH817_02515 [archaeon]
MRNPTPNKILEEVSRFNSDEVRLEYLERLNQENLDEENKKFVFKLISEIYIKKKWWNNAAQAYSRIAELEKTFDGKMNAYLTTAKIYIKAEKYMYAFDTFQKALVLASNKQKPEVLAVRTSAFLNHAQELEKERQLTKAIKAYHKVLETDTDNEYLIKDKIADLYDKIGNPQEANRIRPKKIQVKELPEISKKEEINEIKNLLD